MTQYNVHTHDNIVEELESIWRMHQAAGLSGKMCVYSATDQSLWRSQEPGIKVWFGPGESKIAISAIEKHYREGVLPNTPLLLNPIVHDINEVGSYEPIGSGMFWCTSFTLGVQDMTDDMVERLQSLGLYASPFHRGESKKAGLKVVGFSKEKLAVLQDNKTVPGNKEIFELINLNSSDYYPYYLLSEMSYLGKNGSFYHPSFKEIFDGNKVDDAFIQDNTVELKSLTDANYCWNKYDRHHSLYEKFGTNPENVEHNLKFFELVARDIDLFDATGSDRKDIDDTFEFFAPGWIPKAAVTIVGATGGTGKSSIAHRLAILASIDWKEDEQPVWLGAEIPKENCKGLVIYFSGEDSAAIVNARAKMIDPEGRSNRLMLQRTDFGTRKDGKKKSIGDFLEDLRKLPNVSLVVIDPARKYLEGDEDDAEVVSNFFEAIEEFAIEKKCGMVVVHHLAKQAHPRDTRDIVDLLRGSQVFIDRARAVLGMMRDGAYTIVGLSKNNIPPNLGAIQGERVFTRDADKLDLIMLPGEDGIRDWTISEEELEQIKAEEALKKG